MTPSPQVAVGADQSYPDVAMVPLGGIVGALVGFSLGLLITEVIIGNPASGSGFDWQFWTDVVLTIVGAIVGVALARRYVAQRSGHTTT